jgi:hypothetical protein
MNSKLPLVFTSVVAALGVLALAAPHRDAGAQVASASGSSSASAAPPPPAPLRGSDIPTEASKPPTPAEWKTGRPVTVDVWGNCEAKVLREYLRVACRYDIGVGLVAGDPKDVRAWVSGVYGYDFNAQTWGTPTAMIDLPLRRGQGHVVNFNNVASGGYVGTWGDSGHLIVSWREGDADPVITTAYPVD